MHHLIFSLYMLRRPTYDNLWSGDDMKFVVAKSFTKKEFEKLPDIVGKFHKYCFDNGLVACVDVKLVRSAKERDAELKGSVGFRQFYWMVESLLEYGEIKKIIKTL